MFVLFYTSPSKSFRPRFYIPFLVNEHLALSFNNAYLTLDFALSYAVKICYSEFAVYQFNFRKNNFSKKYDELK